MYSKISTFVSLILLLFWIYRLTRNKIALWIFGYTSYLIISGVVFKSFFPDIKFFSPTLEYMVFLAIVGVPFLILIVLIGVEGDKQKKENAVQKVMPKLMDINYKNISIWLIILFINILGRWLDKVSHH